MVTDDRAGTLVDDRFRLEERLDTGGFATVWRATDRERNLPVALKCEPVESRDRARIRTHFRGELRWFRRFDGGPIPGSLVRFVDGSIDGERAYVATELIRGGSIDDWLDAATGVAPSLEAVRELGGPICRAVGFLHRNGVAHLDLKPGNVLVRRSGTPAVIDLNAAVPIDAAPDVRFDRDPFKPPELVRSDREELIGPRADVYALGAVLAFLATGTTAAATETPASESERGSAPSPDSPSDGVDRPVRDATVPEVLTAPLRRATADRPRDRFEDADALYDALVPVLEAPARTARLVHESSGRTVRVRPGDTLGRWTADPRTPVPTVVLPDDERFLCPEHAVLEHEGSSWRLRDRSVNGTYVRTDAGWEYLLSRRGRERRHEADAPLSRSDPPESTALSDGDRIVPVDPGYGCRLVFRTA